MPCTALKNFLSVWNIWILNTFRLTNKKHGQTVRDYSKGQTNVLCLTQRTDKRQNRKMAVKQKHEVSTHFTGS